MTLTWSASEMLTGKKFQDKSRIVAFKNGRQSYTQTTAAKEDADLTLTLTQPSATYLVEGNYAATGNVSGDIIIQWVATGGATVVRTTQWMALGGTTSSDTVIASREQSVAGWASGTALTPAPCAIREKLIVATGSEPCTLTVWWSQNASSTTPTSVTDYTWLVAHRLT